ncbi:hypothetical protein [Dysgonomonas macrotermitis]|uniref:Uncharacterized protein n=1 Tax=Dysgonomonas macrotermitis TaxID=1346286 RepID=A0A1M5FQA0_9BACT|nr:hypothetical protein [Dysgonomonas macrotermitis]SHF93673.1 hypothetical protein SAMN05444362_11276 [Dysgonomonas macrotermitis]
MKNWTIGIIVSISILSCSNLNKDEFFTNKLSNIAINQPFQLNTIFEEDWDTLYVMAPYERLDSIRGVNFSEGDKNVLMVSTSYEGNATFAFIKNKRMVQHYMIPYTAVDFFPLIDSINYFSPKQKFILDENRVVSLID